MPATYEQFGIKLMYPDNWTVTDEQLDQWPRSVALQSPTSAFWQVHVYPSRTNPKDLVDEVLETLRAEYEEVEWVWVEQAMENALAVGYDLSFFCMDFVVAARVRGFYLQERTFVVVNQAESRDFDELQLVFDAITQSLLKS